MNGWGTIFPSGKLFLVRVQSARWDVKWPSLQKERKRETIITWDQIHSSNKSSFYSLSLSLLSFIFSTCSLIFIFHCDCSSLSFESNISIGNPVFIHVLHSFFRITFSWLKQMMLKKDMKYIKEGMKRKTHQVIVIKMVFDSNIKSKNNKSSAFWTPKSKYVHTF